MNAQGPLLADQRPIVRSEPVIPLETAEFDSNGLANVRQRVISTLPDTSVSNRVAQTTQKLISGAPTATSRRS
jgi:hypothetical protein